MVAGRAFFVVLLRLCFLCSAAGVPGAACCVRPGCSERPWAAAHPPSTAHDLPSSVWSLCVPVGGGPPARSPHASLRLGVVDLEARPGPAATHRHRGRALRSLRRPPHLWGRVTVRQLYASSRSPAGSRRHPPAPRPGPPVPSNPSNRSALGRESPKTQTTSVKMGECGVFWARWSVFWAHGGYE